MFEKRNRWMKALVVGLLALLPVLAVLQYRWLGRLSESEAVRMHANLQASLARFSEDLDRELERTRRAFMFNLGTDPHVSPTEALAERYAAWRNTTAHPGLLDTIFWVDMDGDETRLARFDPDAATLA